MVSRSSRQSRSVASSSPSQPAESQPAKPDAEALVVDVPTAPWVLPFLEPARYKGAYGGRGSGKSHGFADMLVDYALMHEGLRAVCIRETKHSIKNSVKRLLEDKIQARGGNVSAMFRIWERRIDTPGGGVILFEGMQAHNADSIKSLEGMDVAWVEEAQAMSQRSIDMLVPTIRKPGSELWFTWNPGAENDPVETLLRNPKAPRTNAVVEAVSFADNPWFPAELEEERAYCLKTDPDKYAHVWLGEFQRKSQARVFSNWTTGTISLDLAQVRSGALVPLFGADWGGTIDPTVLVRCWVLPGEGRRQTLYVDQEAYDIGRPINLKPALFRSIEDGLVKDVRRWPIVADSAWPDTISYMQAAGFEKMEGARKGAGSLEEGVEFLRSFDIVVNPRCRHAIDELVHYSYKIDKRTETVLPILDDRKNHVIDALRYAVEKLRMASTAGLITYLQEQVQARPAAAALLAPTYALSPPPVGDRVSMRPPAGHTTVYGLSGVLYQVDARGCMAVAPEDVPALKRAGFQEEIAGS